MISDQQETYRRLIKTIMGDKSIDQHEDEFYEAIEAYEKKDYVAANVFLNLLEKK